MRELGHAALAFARTRWLQLRLRTRADVVRHQWRRIAALAGDLEQTIPFYRDRLPRGFRHWPVIDKAALLADFARFNRAGLALNEVRAVLARHFSDARG